MSFLRESKWEYDTWGSTGISIYFFAGTTGELYLKDPGKHVVKFNYLAAGLAAGPKLPKWARDLGVNSAPSSFRSKGSKIYISPNFKGSELTKEDISGVCAILDLGFSLGPVGRNVCLMFLGGSVNNPFIYSPEDGANAALALEGDNVGLGGGASACLGYVNVEAAPSEGIWKIDIGGQIYYYELKDDTSTARWAYDPEFTRLGGTGYRVMNNDHMRINWMESGDYEIWQAPLSAANQTGFWYPKKEQTGEMGFRKYPITAEKLPDS